MASLSTKLPSQAISIGHKVLGYLQRTIGYGLGVRWRHEGLKMCCDAAFAPQGLKSHGGWMISYGSVPIAWRSSRQAMITLSTAEAELLAMLDGAVAAKGVESILFDVGEVIEKRTIASDSTSALSITQGSSSWRTRHLRIKAGWLCEQMSHGIFEAVHCPGERQPADLLTKALSAGRMDALLQWWNIGERHRKQGPMVSTSKVSSRLLVALVCCLLMISAQATDDQASAVRRSGVQLDWDLVGIMMILLMILGALMIWEAVRWFVLDVASQWVPGASQRKLRRLRKLQVATAEAIERELRRLQPNEDESSVQRSTSTSSSMTLEDRSKRVAQSATVIEARRSMTQEDMDGYARRERQRVRTPSPRRQSAIPSTSPGSMSSNDPEDYSEVKRVAQDLCMIMTCEGLKEGLRTEGLLVSGLKNDQAARLGNRLAELSLLPTGPTAKQMKYVLWLWRSKDLSGRYTVRYCELNDRRRISALIHAWKSR